MGNSLAREHICVLDEGMVFGSSLGDTQDVSSARDVLDAVGLSYLADLGPCAWTPDGGSPSG